jgi:hypothetical protein
MPPGWAALGGASLACGAGQVCAGGGGRPGWRPGTSVGGRGGSKIVPNCACAGIAPANTRVLVTIAAALRVIDEAMRSAIQGIGNRWSVKARGVNKS